MGNKSIPLQNINPPFIQIHISMIKPIAMIVLVALLLSPSLGIAFAPEPYCLSKPLYKQFPLTIEEELSHNMADSFNGYNLDISLPQNISFATMSQKLRQLDRMNSYFFNVISHYVQKKDNGVGKDTFLLYQDITGSYHFAFGVITDKNSLPHLNTTVIVTTDKNVKCFDAVLFIDHGLAIVDCMRVNPNNFQEPFTNIFFYVDLTGHKVTSIIENQVYADFKMVTKRKMAKFTNPETHYPYVIRAYFAEGVQAEADNTYIEFFGAQDPHDLQNFGLVDRTYLHEPKLAINDLEVYNGDIYFLDSFVGLYRLDITKDHKLLITGKLKRAGMQKFSVYSDDLQDELIIGLANKHNVYEIDWSWEYMFEHQVVNKYTIPQDSTVKDVKINGKYIIVQSKANVTNNKNISYEIDYTWVFTKGSRTYMNAYQVINHNSSKVDIDFDPELNHIYSADEAGLALFKIDEARLKLKFINQSMIGKTQEIVITAVSSDPMNVNNTMTCTQKMTVIFTGKEDAKIYDTGFQMNTLFSANYPGDLTIPLGMRFMGPNITYGASNFEGQQTPVNWIDKVNKTKLMINTTVKPQDIVFFHTDLLQQAAREQLVYYFQDTTNKTHVAQCIHGWDDPEMACKVTREFQHESKLSSFTTAFILDQQDGDWEYFYIMVEEMSRNKITIVNFVKHKVHTEIIYQGHQEAEVHEVASSNGYLYVLRKNVKTIDVYNLLKCKDNKKCTLEFKIDMYTLKNLGVDYFAPQKIITDVEHPEVLFIKCLGSLVILDVDNKQKIHLLEELKTVATRDLYFRVAVNKYRMVLVSQPNIIEEYNLENIYQPGSVNQVVKNYPLYGYRIQPDADIEFSDNEFLVYVNAYDPKMNVSVILAYQSGFPYSAVLYDTIYLDRLYSKPGFEIEVSGSFVDFVSIAAGDEFLVYRVFEQPMLRMKTTIHDYNFLIKASNPSTMLLTDKINVSIVNFPSGFNPTTEFNDTLPTLKTVKEGNYSWQDRKWFTGHVLSYNYSCEECNDTERGEQKIKLREHVDSITPLQINGNDFIETMFGGIAVHEDLVLFRHNGSVREIINMPDQKLLQTCLKVAAFQTGEFVVTACQQLGLGINLYMTSLQNFKPITIGPFLTEAYHARTLQVVHDVIMIVNQNPYPDFRLLAGSVFLYRASVNPDSYQEFDLLDEIDNDDLLAAHGWDNEEATIGNAYMTFSTFTDTFRLYITEIDHGFFVMDFTRHSWENELHILSVRYVDMHALLKAHDLNMPSGATFQAITFTGVTDIPHFQAQRVLITTKGYHNFQVLIIYDESDHITSVVLHRVYYRYGFYQAYNEVKSISGYVAIGYNLPYIYNIYGYPKQYIAVYDADDYEHESEKGYAERYLLGVFPIPKSRDPVVFAFNKTYDVHTNGTRIGLIVSDPQKNLMYSASLSKTLQFEVKKDFKTQKMNVTAVSDFSNYTFTVPVIRKEDDDDDDDHHHDDHSKVDEILFIIVVIVAAVIIIVFGSYIFCVIRKKNRRQPEERVSLLTGNESFVDDRIVRQTYEAPVVKNLQREDSGYSSDEENQSPTTVVVQGSSENAMIVETKNGENKVEQREENEAQQNNADEQDSSEQQAEKPAEEQIKNAVEPQVKAPQLSVIQEQRVEQSQIVVTESKVEEPVAQNQPQSQPPAQGSA